MAYATSLTLQDRRGFQRALTLAWRAAQRRLFSRRACWWFRWYSPPAEVRESLQPDYPAAG